MSVSRTVSEIFSDKEWRDLETGSRGRSRSLEMTPFDRPYYDFLLIRLEIWVRGHSRSFEMVPFESLGTVSYSPSIVTMALSCISSEIKPDVGRTSCFSSPLAFDAPVMGVPVGILPSRWLWKTRMVMLPTVKKL